MKIGNTAVKVLTKTMGAMALSAVMLDTCHIGKIKTDEFKKEGEGNDTLRNYIGTSKMDFGSPMYSKMKEKFALKYPHRLMDFIHGTKGFLSGFGEGIINHADIIGCSIFALCTKKRAGQLVSAFALAGVCLYNVIKNGTILMEKRNDFEEM